MNRIVPSAYTVDDDEIIRPYSQLQGPDGRPLLDQANIQRRGSFEPRLHLQEAKNVRAPEGFVARHGGYIKIVQSRNCQGKFCTSSRIIGTQVANTTVSLNTQSPAIDHAISNGLEIEQSTVDLDVQTSIVMFDDYAVGASRPRS